MICHADRCHRLAIPPLACPIASRANYAVRGRRECQLLAIRDNSRQPFASRLDQVPPFCRQRYHFVSSYPAMAKFLGKWMDQLRWQRLPSFQKLAAMLIKHLDGILNYCRTKVRFGVVEEVNGNIRMLINRGRAYQNLRPAPEVQADRRD